MSKVFISQFLEICFFCFLIFGHGSRFWNGEAFAARSYIMFGRTKIKITFLDIWFYLLYLLWYHWAPLPSLPPMLAFPSCVCAYLFTKYCEMLPPLSSSTPAKQPHCSQDVSVGVGNTHETHFILYGSLDNWDYNIRLFGLVRFSSVLFKSLGKIIIWNLKCIRVLGDRGPYTAWSPALRVSHFISPSLFKTWPIKVCSTC